MALGSSAPEILLSVIETLQTLGLKPGELGPSTIVGSAAFTWLHDTIARIEFWQLLLGSIFIFLVVAFPQGIAGFFNNKFEKFFQ